MPVQVQYIQLITDAADLSSDVFSILVSVAWKEKKTKFIAVP